MSATETGTAMGTAAGNAMGAAVAAATSLTMGADIGGAVGAAMGALLLLLLKASLLWSLMLLATRLLGRAPAATRHGLWTLGFAAVLALPFLAGALPALSLPLPVPGGWATPVALRTTPDTFSGVGVVGDPRAERQTADDRRTSHPAAPAPESGGDIAPASSAALDPDVMSLRPTSIVPAALWSIASAGLIAAWVSGTLAAAATLLLSLLRVRRLARGAELLSDPAWRSAADALAARLDLRRPARLLVSPDVGTPMAGGLWRPIIFLPASARAWSAEQREVVLAHEIAHLAGRDPLRHLAARLAVACYWFHPLAWIAARQATMAREQACDEAVLALGTRPSAYARVLLDLADATPFAAPALGALPMVERSLLEARLMAILHDDARPEVRRRVLMPAAIGVALLTLSLAAAQPVARASAPRVAATAATPAVASTGSIPSAASPAPTPSTSSTPSAASAPVTAVTPSSPSMSDTAADPSTSSMASTPAISAEAVLAAGQADVRRGSACSWDVSDGESFRGTRWSSDDAHGRAVIHEQIGTRGTDRVIQKTFGDVRLCMVAEDAPDRDRTERPSEWLGRARRVTMEARRGRAVQRLELGREAGGSQRISWQVGGAERPFDAAAQRWRDDMLGAFDTIWELATLRGEVSSLRGQISSIHGQRSSLQGEISSLQGEVSSMRGQISSIRGQESSLRGQISSIEGHVSALRGAISSEQGAISSLNAGRGYDTSDAERARVRTRLDRHDGEITRIEKEIRDYGAAARIAAVEREIAALDADGKTAAIEARIRAFDLNGKIAAIDRRIAELDVPGKVAAIERQIAALDADRRSRQLEERRDAELKQLEAAIAAIR